jgi:lipopolysaccharide/colanic/teichoic acid biosynthesis glycosyltransferase
VAAVLILVLLPGLLIIALAIKLDSPGPVFYRVKRVGYRGRSFWMLKFRKMHHDARGAPLTTASDPRLTRVGRLLTRTRIDELPQLWDVLRGRMSLIGPRPEDPRFVALHEEAYRQILRVRPGITGITQLAFSSERTILDRKDPLSDYVGRLLPRKVELDLLYIQRLSARIDLAVLCWTLRSTITGEDVAVNRANARLTPRQPRQEPMRRPELVPEAASC